jgi:hypothetical protein
MNDKLIDQLLQMLKNGVDFTIGELPDIARQVLEFSYFSNIVWVGVFGGLVSLFTVLLLGGILVQRFSREIDCEMYIGLVGVGFAMVLLISMIAVPAILVDNYKIKHCPKLYLIDYLQGKLSQ